MTDTPSLPPLRRAWAQIRPVLAGGAKVVLRSIERLLHPLRRRAAVVRVRRLAPVGSISVLCYGNICRSPYAAAILTRALAARGLICAVTQGGFFGPNRPANDRGATVALARGTDLGNHRSRLVTADEARSTELLVVMEAYQARRLVREFGVVRGRVLLLGDLDPGPIASRPIHDPYGLDPSVFNLTYDRIDRCIAELARLLDTRPS